jgi:hypothetical protein
MRITTTETRSRIDNATSGEAFPDTEPMHEAPNHRRKEGRRWWRYEPNYLPVGERLLYGTLTLTWLAWAAIGILSGHMFFLVSRRAPIHFSGLPALIFAGAVLASAAACASKIIDHYDQRNNEAAYARLKKTLWYGAGILFLLAILVAFAETASVLPFTDGRLGLLHAAELKMLLASGWMASKLQPHVEALHFWSAVSFAWFMGAGLCFKWLGLIDDQHNPAHVTRNFLAAAVLVLPALATFTLSLLADLSVGKVAMKAGLPEDQVQAQVAWAHSMLVACLGAWFFVGSALLMVFLRWLGVLPSLQAELAKKNRADSSGLQP